MGVLTTRRSRRQIAYNYVANAGTSNVCEVGVPVTAAAECQKAASDFPGFEYRSDVSETESGKITIDYAPGGCMLYDGPEGYYHGLYLNMHPGSHTGSVDHYKVCKVDASAATTAEMSGGAIAGIVVGVVFGVLLAISGFLLICWRKRSVGMSSASHRAPPAQAMPMATAQAMPMATATAMPGSVQMQPNQLGTMAQPVVATVVPCATSAQAAPP